MQPGALDPTFSDLFDGQLEQHLDLLCETSDMASALQPECLFDSMQPKGGQKHDMLRGKALTDVLGHVSGHYEGGGQDRPTNDLLHKPLWLPDSLSAPPLLPMRQSQKDDATWGASFDLHNIAQPPQVLSERSSLKGVPTDAMSYIGPAAPVACLPLPAADPSQVTSSHSADGRPNSQQAARSPFEEMLASDKEDKPSDDDLKTKPFPKRNSRSYSADLERKSADTPLDQKKIRKREKDRIEDIQAEINKVMESNAKGRLAVDLLQSQLQEKEEMVRQIMAAEDSSSAFPTTEGSLVVDFQTPMRLSIFGDSAREPRDFTSEQVRCMNDEVLSGIWGLLVSQMRELLRCNHIGSGNPQNQQRLCTLQWEAVNLHIRSALAAPTIIKSIQTKGAMDGTRRCPDPGFWRMVLQSLRLLEEQQGRLHSLWQSHQDCLGRLMAVRRSITQHISGTMPDGLFGRSFAINFLKAHELMDALKYNLRQEHIALSEFMANAHKILSPLQNATLFVNSWPFWPDLPNLVALAVDSTSL